MKAMVMTSFGGPEVFMEQDVPTPRPGDHDLLVRVHATSVNPVDYKIRRSGSWTGITPPAIIGFDVSGVVDAVGPGVRDFAVGDEVFYVHDISGGPGCYAEYHKVNEAIAARKPVNLSHIEAASIPLAGGTVWDSIVTRTEIRLGETILIHAGAGGVGSLAVQIAKISGAYVFTTCGSYNNDLVKKLGADRTIDYRTENFVEAILKETSGRGVDVVFDTVGGETLSKSIEAVKPYGRIASIVTAPTQVSAAYGRNITLHFVRLRRARSTLDALRSLIERGRIKPVIDTVMPLTSVAQAHQKLEKGGVRGKIVLQVV